MLENMIQGTMFITPKHVCFYSTFWGTERKVLVSFLALLPVACPRGPLTAIILAQEVISFDDVHAIEKKNTARIIPNALEISVGRDEKEVKVVLQDVSLSFLSELTTRSSAVFLWHFPQPARSLQSASEPLGT